MFEEFHEIVIPFYLKEKVEIQKRLTDISTLGVDDMFHYLTESFLDKSDEDLIFIIQEICYISQIRIHSIPQLIALSKLLINTKKCETLFIQNCLKLNANHLLFALYDQSIVSLQNLINFQHQFSKQTKLFISPIIQASTVIIS